MSEVNSNEMVEVTEPIALDSTLQSLVTAVQDLSEAVAPSNAYVDIAATLSVSGWSNATPSVYTWTDNKVTGSCGIQVFFANGAENNPTPYLDYEKGVGSVILYAPSKPTSDVPVVFRIINADAEIASNIDATMVSTDAISGASNVQQALGSVNSSISALNGNIGVKDFPSELTTLLGLISNTYTPLGQQRTYSIENSKITELTDWPSDLSNYKFCAFVDVLHSSGNNRWIIRLTAISGSGVPKTIYGYPLSGAFIWSASL